MDSIEISIVDFKQWWTFFYFENDELIRCRIKKKNKCIFRSISIWRRFDNVFARINIKLFSSSSVIISFDTSLRYIIRIFSLRKFSVWRSDNSLNKNACYSFFLNSKFSVSCFLSFLVQYVCCCMSIYLIVF